MSVNVEVGLISKVISTSDFVVVTDKQVNGMYFNGRNKIAFRFIQKHVLKYGKVPSKRAFLKKYPAYPLEEGEDIDESLSYYCDEVRNKKKHNTIIEVVEEVSDLLEELETDQAYKMIQKLVTKIENEVVLSERAEVNKNTEARMNDYIARSKAGGMTGIPSGIDRLDWILKGFNGGELTALLGYTGTGKTWFELIIAVYMSKQGYKVLLFTTEMATKMMIRRIDAVWAKLSYSRFRDGRLTSQELDRYKHYLTSIEGDTDSNLIVEQATGGVAQIGAKIDQHKPDMVFIDGAYLLEDDESEDDDWRALVRIFRGLHRLALQKDVPIFASTQSKDRKVALDTISFAKAISNDCDIVLALEQDDEMKQDREIKVKFLKIREGSIPGNIMMEWDFDNMKYETIYIESHDGSRVDEKGLIKQDKDDRELEEEPNKDALPQGVQVLE
jgi:replicative DNA helicase